MKNILELLEATAARLPDKTAFADESVHISYGRLQKEARAAGTCLAKCGERNRPVAVLMARSAECLEILMGVLYSGNFYVVLDPEMPSERAGKILRTLQPAALVCDRAHEAAAAALNFSGSRFIAEEILLASPDDALLCSIRRRMIDTDPAYAIFTSGSTGSPKGLWSITAVCWRILHGRYLLLDSANRLYSAIRRRFISACRLQISFPQSERVRRCISFRKNTFLFRRC